MRDLWSTAGIAYDSVVIDRSPMKKISKLQTLSLIVLGGFLFALGFDHACATYLEIPLYPHCTFLYRPELALNDLLGLMASNRNLDPFHNTFRTYGVNYPPFTYLLMLPFTNVLAWPWAAVFYITCTATGILAFVAWACRTGREDDPARLGWIAALVIGAASYPFLFAMDRLNAE